jgi:methyl-accepting chemotaxis protein
MILSFWLVFIKFCRLNIELQTTHGDVALSVLSSKLPYKAGAVSALIVLACLVLQLFIIPHFEFDIYKMITVYLALAVFSFGISLIIARKNLQEAQNFIQMVSDDAPETQSVQEAYKALVARAHQAQAYQSLLSALPCLILHADEKGHILHVFEEKNVRKNLEAMDLISPEEPLCGQNAYSFLPFLTKNSLGRKECGKGFLIGLSSVENGQDYICVYYDPGLQDMITLDSDPEMIKHLSRDLAQLLFEIKAQSSSLSNALSAMSQGDFTCHVQGGEGVFRQLGEHANECMTNLSQMIYNLDNAIKVLSADIDVTCEAAVDLSERSQRQSTALQQTATTMEQLSSTVQSSAENASKGSHLAAEARKSAHSGGQTVQAAIEAMERIEDSSGRITQIVSLIDDVAFQTNLLALNAAVEAARAGEAGKGFAVVAAEVRTLAQRAGQASKEIKTLIESTQLRVSEGVNLVRKTDVELGDVVSSIGTLDQIMAEIASATRQQAIGISEVTATVSHMDAVTSQTADMIETTAKTLNNARQKLTTLKEWTADFTVERVIEDHHRGMAKLFHNQTYENSHVKPLMKSLSHLGPDSLETMPLASDIHSQRALLSNHFHSSQPASRPSSVSAKTVAKFLHNQEDWHEF